MAEATPSTKQLGARIKQAREAAGMKQEDLGAKLAELGHKADSKQTVSSWENGRNIPSALVIKDIARLCRTTTDALLTGQDRWPFAAQLLDQVSRLDDRQRIKLEGAIEMWLQQNAPPSDNASPLEQAA